MKKFTYMDMAALLIWALPIIYLVSVYSSLPAIVPLHYGADGKPNRYGNKSEMITVAAMMLFVSLGIYRGWKLARVYIPPGDKSGNWQIRHSRQTCSPTRPHREMSLQAGAR